MDKKEGHGSIWTSILLDGWGIKFNFFSCLLLQINSNFIKLSHLITLLFFGFWLSCLRWLLIYFSL